MTRAKGFACLRDCRELPVRSYNEWMRHPRLARYRAIGIAMWPVIVALSPVIVLAGEPVNRYVMRWRRARWAVRSTQAPLSLPASVILAAMSNPLWIALTAPGRWVGDQFASPASTGR